MLFSERNDSKVAILLLTSDRNNVGFHGVSLPKEFLKDFTRFNIQQQAESIEYNISALLVPSTVPTGILDKTQVLDVIDTLIEKKPSLKLIKKLISEDILLLNIQVISWQDISRAENSPFGSAILDAWIEEDNGQIKFMVRPYGSIYYACVLSPTNNTIISWQKITQTSPVGFIQNNRLHKFKVGENIPHHANKDITKTTTDNLNNSVVTKESSSGTIIFVAERKKPIYRGFAEADSSFAPTSKVPMASKGCAFFQRKAVGLGEPLDGYVEEANIDGVEVYPQVIRSTFSIFKADDKIEKIDDIIGELVLIADAMLSEIIDREVTGKILHIGSTSHITQSAKLVKNDDDEVNVFTMTKEEFHKIIPKAKALTKYDFQIILNFVEEEEKKKTFDTKKSRKEFILSLLKTNVDIVAGTIGDLPVKTKGGCCGKC